MTLSIVISTYNRSKSLERTLVSVKNIADEIIVVDNFSTDDTLAVAKRYTRKIFRRPNKKMLNVNKNFGIEKATGDWILYLDDDEVMTDELIREIRSMEKAEHHGPGSEISGYWIARKNMIFGKWIQHGIWWPDHQLRLFRRGQGKYALKHVHEYIDVDGPTATLSAPYIHYNYDSISQYLFKMESIYTENEVEKHVAAGYQVDWHDALRFPISDFVKLYFAQRGYKDGMHGLILAILQAFYSFIVFAKLWERSTFIPITISTPQMEAEITRSLKEVRYWMLTTRIQQSKDPLSKLWFKLLRRSIDV